jgi:hypothetical protein
MKKAAPVLMAIALSAMFSLQSCKQPVTNEKPGSHARISEVLVVMDKTLWDGALGDSVRTTLGEWYPFLNQPQPKFSIICRQPSEFKEPYPAFRNILYFINEPERNGGNIQKVIDYWAKPQTVIQINGDNEATLLGLFLKNRSAIMKAFDESEIRRLKGVMASISNSGNAGIFSKRFGLSVAVPEGYYIAKDKPGFTWARKVIKSQTQETAFWITEIPYTDTSQFNPKKVLALRDSICKANIPVQNETSYMGTEYRFGYLSTPIRLNGYYALETRGFWRTYGDYSMGGPYLNYLIHDEKQGRLIMMDCYVMKPNEDKRDLVRQLEGIAWTIKL